MNKKNEEKRFYLDLENATYCYPYKTNKIIKSLGVLEKYKNKRYTQREINKIIAELIIKVPYIENAMNVEICVKYKDNKNCVSYYHILNFKNMYYEYQEKDNEEIKFLYPDEI